MKKPLDRRSFLSFAVLGAATVSLAACGGGKNGAGPAPDAVFTAPAADLSATLTYAIWDAAQKPGMQQIIDSFNEQYPNIKVNIDVSPYAQYWTKIQTQASSNSLPDVFWMNGPNIKLYAANDQLLSLEGLKSAKSVDTSNYPKALVELYSDNDTLYGIPKDYDTIGLFYNKALFKEAGVAEPTGAWTWEDAKKAGAAISKANDGKGVYGFAGNLTGGQTSYYNTILAAGGDVISSDGKTSGYGSPEAIAGLEFWRDIVSAGISPSMQQLTDTSADDMFTSKKVAMTWSGSWSAGPYAKALDADLGLTALPMGPVSNQCVIHGLANVIPANVKNRDAAQAFVAFLGSKKAAEIQAESGTVIPAFNDTQDAWVKSVPSVDLNIFLDAAAKASPYPASKNTSAWNQFETGLLPAAFAGSKPVPEVAKELAAKMNDTLSKES